MSDELSGAFDAPAAGEPANTQVPGVRSEVSMEPPPDGGTRSWEKAYDGHADLRDFARAKEGDPLTWEYDHEKVAKVLKDRQSHIGKLEATIASLRGQEAKDALTVAGSVEDYTKGFDHEALKAKAARAYVGRNEKGVNSVENTFFNAMYEQGIPVEKARDAFSGFMVGLNEHIAVPRTPEEQLAESAKALGPNGRQMIGELNEWLASEHARDPLSKEMQAETMRALRNPAMAAFMHRAMRRQATAAPPTVHSGAGDTLTQDEVNEAMVSDRYKTDTEYRKRILDAAARLQKDAPQGGSYRVAVNL